MAEPATNGRQPNIMFVRPTSVNSGGNSTNILTSH